MEQDKQLAVRGIIAELQRDHSIWCDKVREFELASAASLAGSPTTEADRLQIELQELAVDIESYISELNFLGVSIDAEQLFSVSR